MMLPAGTCEQSMPSGVLTTGRSTVYDERVAMVAGMNLTIDERMSVC